MATQPDQMRFELGPLVEKARLSLPYKLSQSKFFVMCDTRFGLSCEVDAFKLHLRGISATSAEDFAVMCHVMNKLLEEAGKKPTLPRDIPLPNGRPGNGKVIPINKDDDGTPDRARFLSSKAA